MISIKDLMKSFGYAFEGVRYALEHDQNLRIHFAIASVVMIVSILLHISSFEMGIIGLMILLVIMGEMINSAVEQMVDLISSEHRKQAKIAKDVAAGMVLVTAMGSVIVGILIFIPHILRLFQ